MSPSTILLVEDNRILAKLFGEALGALPNVSITIFNNGRDAQQFLQEQTPQTIILDLHLPQVSGAQLIQEICADDRFKHAQIIVMTADTFLGDKIRNWYPTVSKIMYKPILIDQLIEAIETT